MQNVQTRTHSWASQFEDQNCECAERSMVVEDDCYCCQNDGGFETQRHQMDVCKDCPDSQLCTGPPWQRSQGECSNSTGNHRDLIVKENESSDKNADDDDWPGGDEDERSDSDNDDDYSDNDDDDDENSDDNMEVDDNFRKFLQQSERHRHEREQSKLTVATLLIPRVHSIYTPHPRYSIPWFTKFYMYMKRPSSITTLYMPETAIIHQYVPCFRNP